MYLLGREIAGSVLGLWCASLLAISVVDAVFAGLARPYALAEFSLALFLYVFVREWKKPAEQRQSAGPVLAAAVFVQLMQWMLWPVVFPFLVFDIVRRWRDGATFGRLAKQSWWYVIASVLLLVYFRVQMMNPTMHGRAGDAGMARIWAEFALASPFGRISRFRPALVHLSAALTIALTLIGMICALRRQPKMPARWPMLAALPALIILGLLLGEHARFWMTYMVPIGVFCGIALICLLGERKAALATVVAVLLAFNVLAIAFPEDPSVRIIRNDGPYRLIAERLKQELQPQDVWAGWSYFTGDNLYRYGPLPEPARLLTLQDLKQWMATPTAGRKFLVTGHGTTGSDAIIARAKRRWPFDKGFYVLEL
jgi:asparagine N-glycosylation enzyme membrane subunit Stt3